MTKKKKIILACYLCIYLTFTLLLVVFQGKNNTYFSILFHLANIVVLFGIFDDRVFQKRKITKITVLTLIWINSFLLSTFLMIGGIIGPSMEPTVRDRQIFLQNQHTFQIRRFDIICFEIEERYQAYAMKNLIKRVVGMPGDTIQIVGAFNYDAEIVINGNSFHKLPTGAWAEHAHIIFSGIIQANNGIIPQGYYFVLGDNRNNSFDSRYFGLIHHAQIKSKAILF